MATEQEITDALDKVLIPGAMRSLASLNLVRQATVDGGKVSITLSSTALHPEIQNRLKESVSQAVKRLDGTSEVAVEFTDGTPKELNEVGNIIAVMSD